MERLLRASISRERSPRGFWLVHLGKIQTVRHLGSVMKYRYHRRILRYGDAQTFVVEEAETHEQMHGITLNYYGLH